MDRRHAPPRTSACELGRLEAEPRRDEAVPCRRGASALDMSEHGRTDFLTQPFFEHPLHIGGANVISIAILSALRHDHDVVAAPGAGPGSETFQHHALPVILVRRRLGDQHPIRAGG